MTKGFLSKKRRAGFFIILLTALIAAPLFQSTAARVATGASDEDFKPTTVILVRHAEKSDAPPEDPRLSQAGVARSQKLASLLAEAGVKAIITSQFTRTKQTAEPLAQRLGITPVSITLQSKPSNPREVSEQSIRQIVDKIMERQGDTVLIVGHTNSVPDVIRMLGGDIVPSISEQTFDDLFIVTVFAKGKAKVTHLKY